tara:strand:+ start:525 stop:1247 length:723 start_codon:yes stop_codon:yes gene_type:complete
MNSGMKKILLACVFTFVSLGANAEFVAGDWKVEGDGLVTADLDTGIEWLSLTETRGMSFNQVSTLLSAEYAGWRLPTRAEVNGLMANITGLVTQENGQKGYSGSRSIYQRQAFDVIDVIGETERYTHHSIARGMYLNDDVQVEGEAQLLYSGAAARITNSSGTINIIYDDYPARVNDDFDTVDTGAGFFLVSDGGTTLLSLNNPTVNAQNANAPADVPAPVLGSFAMFGLLLFGRRKLKA